MATKMREFQDLCNKYYSIGYENGVKAMREFGTIILKGEENGNFEPTKITFFGKIDRWQEWHMDYKLDLDDWEDNIEDRLKPFLMSQYDPRKLRITLEIVEESEE